MTDIHLPHGPFWQSLGAQAVTAITVLIGVFIGFGRQSEKIDTLGNGVAENKANIMRMDQQGTQASQRKLEIELVTLNGHEQRMLKVEDAIADIRVMKEQISRIGTDVKEIKDGGPHKP